MLEVFGWVSVPAQYISLDGDMISDRGETLQNFKRLHKMIEDMFSFCKKHNENDVHSLCFSSFRKRSAIEDYHFDAIIEFIKDKLNFSNFCIKIYNLDTGIVTSFEKFRD